MFVEGTQYTTIPSFNGDDDPDSSNSKDSQTALINSLAKNALNETARDFYSRGKESIQTYLAGIRDTAEKKVSAAVKAYNRIVEPYWNRSWSYSRCPYLNSLASSAYSYSPRASDSFITACEYTRGVSKGIYKGLCESGRGLGAFLKNLASEPVQTCQQIGESLEILNNLAKANEWKLVAEILVPELCKLFNEWDHLSPDERGELAGYAIGKNGGDLLIPGAIAKAAAKGLKSSSKIINLAKKAASTGELITAEATTAAEVATLVEKGQKASSAGERLSLAPKRKYNHLSVSSEESISLHKNAQKILRKYTKIPLPEATVRQLIHEAGFPTFPRPRGVPKDFLVMVSDSGAGMVYVHPTNSYTKIRVMPGKMHSLNPAQRKPYISHLKDGQYRDKLGKAVPRSSEEAHIPLELFKYTE